MSNPMRWTFVLPGLAAIIVVLAAVTGTPEKPNRDPSAVDMRRTIAACPNLGTKADMAVGAEPGTTVDIRPGDEQVAGSWGHFTVDDDAPTVTARSSDGSAAAMAFEHATATESRGAGLIVASCPREHAEQWWVGPGGSADRATRMELVNPSDAPAVADVTLWGHDGPIDAESTYAVEPHERKLVSFSELVAGEPELAVRLQVRRGAVAASMLDSGALGSEILPATSAPATTTTVSGVDEPENSELILANPGERTARAEVSVLADDGRLEPEGLDDVTVPAGQVTTVQMPDSAGSRAGAIRIQATHPLIASARVQPAGDDYAYAVARPPLRDRALVPLEVDGTLPSPRVIVTAQQSTTVHVRTFDADFAELGQSEHQVDAHTTHELDLSSDKDLKPADAVVAVIDGDVSGAAVFGDDEHTAAIPLEPVVARVLAPDIQIGPVVQME